MTIKTIETIERFNEEGKLIEKIVREITEEKTDAQNVPMYPHYPNWWSSVTGDTSTPIKTEDYPTSATETSASGKHSNLTKHNIVSVDNAVPSAYPKGELVKW